MQNDDKNIKRVLIRNVFIILPIALIACFVVFTGAYFEFLLPLENNYVAQHYRLLPKLFMAIIFLTPIIYGLWLSFSLMLLFIRLTYFHFPVIDLKTILGLHIPVMWMWTWGASIIFQIKSMFRYIIDSTLTLEAWGLLGVFATLIILMEAIFLRGQILIFNYDYEDTSYKDIAPKQIWIRYLKNMFLCSVTLVFTTVIIIYI